MTPRQRAVYNTIRSYIAEHGRPPTLRELAQALGISHITVLGHVRRLRTLGYLQEVGRYTHRGYWPTVQGKERGR